MKSVRSPKATYCLLKLFLFFKSLKIKADSLKKLLTTNPQSLQIFSKLLRIMIPLHSGHFSLISELPSNL